MNTTVRVAFALGVVAAASAAVRAPVAAAPTVRMIAHRAATDSQEIALGAALAARFDADRGIVPSPETQRIEAYLQRIADSLGRHARRKLPWRIHFDPHPGIKSGFALPGGQIVIWGGILAYMTTEDEAAAVIAHEIEHIDDGQVTRRIDSLVRTAHRDVAVPSQWSWDEFGASYGETLENLCDYKGAKLAVAAGYSPLGFKLILESFVALGRVHSPNAPPAKAIVERVRQIEQEITAEHWQSRTKTRPLQLPGNG